jgi:hypothetical protein
VSLPSKKKNIKGREGCEMPEKVSPVFQVQVLKQTGDSVSNPEQD